MDIAGLKPLFGQPSLVVAGATSFIGTVREIPGSTAAVSMDPITDAATVNYYSFAVNGVTVLSLSAITFAQKLAPAPT